MVDRRHFVAVSLPSGPGKERSQLLPPVEALCADAAGGSAFAERERLGGVILPRVSPPDRARGGRRGKRRKREKEPTGRSNRGGTVGRRRRARCQDALATGRLLSEMSAANVEAGARRDRGRARKSPAGMRAAWAAGRAAGSIIFNRDIIVQ